MNAQIQNCCDGDTEHSRGCKASPWSTRTSGERCDCGHKRMMHAGATTRNDGGNECRACDCPLYMKE